MVLSSRPREMLGSVYDVPLAARKATPLAAVMNVAATMPREAAR
jgi:hypothetical protein